MLVRMQAAVAPAIGDVDALAACLLACGFDAAWYLHKYPDLRQAGLDPAAALLHFIMDGVTEDREAIFGPMGAGLQDLAAFPFRDRGYAKRMVRRVFLGQLRDAGIPEPLWSVADASLVATIRAHGGIPYAVFGDSHACHYQRSAWVGERWLAPLAFPRPAASATGLLNERSSSATGRAILDWARGPARRAGGIGIPIFMKFGGMDAEYLWMMRRVRNGVRIFTAEEFDDFARYSVARYGRFIAALCEFVDRALLRICTPFPAILGDAHWAERFIGMQGGSAEQRQEFASALAQTEIPNLRVRTLLRRVYIRHLRAMCAAEGLRCIDDFSPLLGPDGLVQPVYLGPYRDMDNHVGYDESRAALLACIMEGLDLSP